MGETTEKSSIDPRLLKIRKPYSLAYVCMDDEKSSDSPSLRSPPSVLRGQPVCASPEAPEILSALKTETEEAPPPEASLNPGPTDHFYTTHWSVVLRAGEDASQLGFEALEQLCQTYYRPLLAYARQVKRNEDEARDLTQGFFEVFLEKRIFRAADPARGRFRSYLVTSFKHYILKEWHKGQAAKRGGRHAILPLDVFTQEQQDHMISMPESASPMAVYDKQWATDVFRNARAALKAHYESTGKGAAYRLLRPFLCGKARTEEAYAEVAAQLGVSSGSVPVYYLRLREQLLRCLHDEIAQTVTCAEDVEDELRYLIHVLKSDWDQLLHEDTRLPD